MSYTRVIEAFEEVRDGRSPEYIICHQTLGEQYLQAARGKGVEGSDVEINSKLLNLRKRGLLKDHPTTQRKKPDPNLKIYINAALNSARLLEKQFEKTVDDIICDPQTRSQFDALVIH